MTSEYMDKLEAQATADYWQARAEAAEAREKALREALVEVVELTAYHGRTLREESAWKIARAALAVSGTATQEWGDVRTGRDRHAAWHGGEA